MLLDHLTPYATAQPHVFDVTTEGFQADVLERSLKTPVLVDFWAEWCEPCKQLGPVLERLAAEYGGAFVLAKVDVEREQQLAEYFQVRSIPTVMLVKGGQLVDGFPGALSEAKLREFLAGHGIVALDSAEPEAIPAPTEPQMSAAERVEVLRGQIAAEPDRVELKLDLAVALGETGDVDEALALIDALPASLSNDDRVKQTRARAGFARLLADAPPLEVLRTRVEGDPADLAARHLFGARLLVSGQEEAAIEQFLEMLRRDRTHADGLPRRALIDAFAVMVDVDLVSRSRRRMASLLF